MNLSEALLELQEKDHLLGVFAELVGHLNKLTEEDAKIPIYNSTEEFVDEGYIDEVRDVLQAQIDGLEAARKKILDWKVERGGEDPPEDDDGGAGGDTVP